MKKAIITTMLLLGSIPALAEEVAQATAEAATGSGGLRFIAIGFAVGIAALGGALGQGKIGASAMDGIARNPQAYKEMFIPMILGLVFIESLVIYALVLAFIL